ncbi:MAG: BrnT family toxin [Candidatus Blackburnbacteria bacterium]|nr:BrnT family toxin [Candidatus Blackburnbacteria bacterium]
MRVDSTPLEFEWDKGNIGKNKKHKVEDQEAEEIFLDQGKVIFKDKLHSQVEERFIVIGKTKKERLLYICFTRRKEKIRIISARDINKKEVSIYEETA